MITVSVSQAAYLSPNPHILNKSDHKEITFDTIVSQTTFAFYYFKLHL